MKKIINGKMYNTNTAKFLGEYSYGNPRDFQHFSEEIYQKTTGEFFLYGEGGPMSKYSRSCGTNDICGSEVLIPLSIHEAKEWIAENLDADTYITIFGDVKE